MAKLRSPVLITPSTGALGYFARLFCCIWHACPPFESWGIQATDQQDIPCTHLHVFSKHGCWLWPTCKPLSPATFLSCRSPANTHPALPVSASSALLPTTRHTRPSKTTSRHVINSSSTHRQRQTGPGASALLHPGVPHSPGSQPQWCLPSCRRQQRQPVCVGYSHRSTPAQLASTLQGRCVCVCVGLCGHRRGVVVPC